MLHLDDGVLRRMVDEPRALSPDARSHVSTCLDCHTRYEMIAADVRDLTVLLEAPPISTDPVLALEQVRDRLGTIPRMHEVGTSVSVPRAGGSWRWLRAPLAGLAVAVSLVGALTLTPAGSLAQSLITIFQPQQVAVISVTSSDLQTLPQLNKFGTTHIDQTGKPVAVADAAAAAQKTGLHVLVPGVLPSSVPTSVQYEVVPSTSGTFTFSAARAQQEAVREGKTLPAMPPRIDGSTLRVTSGVAEVAVYSSGKHDMPALVIGQMAAPKVQSTGVTLTELEDYVLRLPGISSQLASQVRALGDPTATLPIPVLLDRTHADKVQVQGVQGLAMGDSTGIGSVVVWEKGGVIYGVGGTLSQNEVLSIANSLH